MAGGPEGRIMDTEVLVTSEIIGNTIDNPELLEGEK